MQENQEPIKSDNDQIIAENLPDTNESDKLLDNEKVVDQEATFQGNVDESSDDHQVSDINQVTDDHKNSAGIPEWGKKDPISWGKYVERQTKKALAKQHQKEVDELKARLERIEKGSVKEPELEEGSTLFIDPKTGMQLDAETVEGQAALNEYALEKKRNEYSQQRYTQETQKLLDQNIENLAAKLEEASFKDKELYSTVAETIDNSKHSPKHIVDFVANMPNNQVEFLSYLTKNKKEWDKITGLNPLMQHQQLLNHFANFSRVSKKSSAPEPIAPLASKSSPTTSSMSPATLQGAEQLMRAKYCNNR